jgi:hypothetical protein
LLQYSGNLVLTFGLKELKDTGIKGTKLTLYFSASSSTSTWHCHVANMAGAHWAAYKAHCLNKNILPYPAAVLESEHLSKDG